MRAALWLLALFAVAAAVALFAGNNQGTISVFWPPWRVDLSLNLVLLLLVGAFVLLHVALRAMSALFSLPVQARQWRMQQKERALHVALLDAMAHLMAGRFSRARKAAQAALTQEAALSSMGTRLPQAPQVRALAHVLAAESAQALQDRRARDEHLQLALATSVARADSPGPEAREGAQLSAARWALEDHDAPAALGWLEELPQGAQRRTLALRLRLKAARLDRRTLEALETTRLLAKHRAFSGEAAQIIVRGLAIELLNGAHDQAQLLRAWSQLDPAERRVPEVAIHGAQRMVALQGDLALARAWLLPVWSRMVEQPESLADGLPVKLTAALEAGLDSVDSEWLARIETAQRANPRDVHLQYLAGMACMKRQLWGKAQQLLTQAGLGLQDPGMHRRTWCALAELAEARGDMDQAAQAWKCAAQTHKR